MHNYGGVKWLKRVNLGGRDKIIGAIYENNEKILYLCGNISIIVIPNRHINAIHGKSNRSTRRGCGRG